MGVGETEEEAAGEMLLLPVPLGLIEGLAPLDRVAVGLAVLELLTLATEEGLPDPVPLTVML